jgi:serpin B
MRSPCLLLLAIFAGTMGCRRPEPSTSPVSTTPVVATEVEVKPAAVTRVHTPPKQKAAPDDLKKLTHGNTAFALDLYAALKSEKQLFVSPYSISTALAMLYAGARGTTAEEIAKTCRYGWPPEELPEVYANLIWNQIGGRKSSTTIEQMKDGKLVKFKPAYQWHDANAAWGRQGAPFRTEYVDLLKRCFAAEVRQANFADAATPAAISRWIAEHTQHKIKDLKIKTDANTQLVLVNAVYFKADWWQPFLPSRTYDEAFHLSDADKAKVPMMHGERSTYRYISQSAFEMLELTYQGDASMLILLPKKVGLAELDPLLTADNLTTWLGKMHVQAAFVTLPKFELKQELKLNDTLKAMGMKKAFDPSADFSGIVSGEPLFVDRVVHATYVKLDEQGTEAAATTVVEGKKDAAEKKPEVPIDFRVNRPFLFIIRDNLTGSVLFLGKITDPRVRLL